MRRYALTALAIGGLVSLVVLVLYFLGAFEPMAEWLGELYKTRGVIATEEVVRLKWLEIVTIVLASLGVAWCLVDVSQIGQKILILLCSVLVVIGLSPTLALHNWLWEPFSTGAAVFLVAALGFAFAGTERGMRKGVLETVVGQRVSRKTFDELLERDSPPDFAGVTREVSVLTCRIFDHAELREELEPAELIKMGNLFLRSVSNFLVSRGAYLDESGPELVRAYFGMIHPSDRHAQEACEAAIELRTRLRNLSQECESRWFRPLNYGIGISSGEMTVGVYGTFENRFFSAMGSETDFSRRLSHANHRYGTDILIGPDTFRLVQQEFALRPMEMFYNPESVVMTEIYDLIARLETLSEEEIKRRDSFWEGVIFLREERFEEALNHFSSARRPGEDDAALDFFTQKAQEGIAESDGGSGTSEAESSPGHARLINLM